MYYLWIEGVPDNYHRKKRYYKGTFINCWIEAPDMNLALKEVKEYLKRDGWQVKNIEEMVRVNRDDYNDQSSALIYFNHALEMGISVIYHNWTCS